MGAIEYMSPLIDLYPEPIPGYKFWVFLQTFTLGFSKISNLEEAIETEPFHEGGVNYKTFSLQKALSSEKVMVFERGVANRGMAAKLLTSQFRVGNRIFGDIFIMVFGRDQFLGKMYLVNGCTVKKWSLSELNAMSSEVLIERFEITYETIEDMPLTTEMADAVQKSIKLGISGESISDLFQKNEKSAVGTGSGFDMDNPVMARIPPKKKLPDNLMDHKDFPEKYFTKKGPPKDMATGEKDYPEEFFTKKKPPKDVATGEKDYPEEFFTKKKPPKDVTAEEKNYPEEYFTKKGSPKDPAAGGKDYPEEYFLNPAIKTTKASTPPTQNLAIEKLFK